MTPLVRGLAVAAVAVALLSWSQVLQAGVWWPRLCVVVLVVLATGAMVRRPWWRLAAQCAALILVLVFLVGTTVVTDPGRLVRSAVSTIWMESPPVPAGKPLVLVLGCGVGLVLILVDLIASRTRAALPIAVVVVVIGAIPATITGFAPAPALIAAVMVLWLVIFWLESGVRSALPHVLAAVVATTVVASVMLPVLPTSSGGTWNWSRAAPGAFRPGVNPMIELGRDLRRGSNTEVLRYTSTGRSARYLKVGTLDEFDGSTWQAGESRSRRPEQVRVPEDAEIETLRIWVTQLESPRIPIPYPATELRGVDERWTWMRPGGTAQLTDGAISGQTFSVDHVVRDVSLERMRAARVSRDVNPRYVDLPEHEDLETIREIAKEATKEASGPHAIASALQMWFRQNFEYSETAPVADGYDGTGYAHVLAFLEEASGYCVHYASTMAIMLRALEIPARVVVGYAPSSSVTVRNGRQIWTTRSHDAHAWVEVHFAGIGWIPFDPTPSVGSATIFSSTATGSSTPAESGPAPRATQRQEQAEETPEELPQEIVETTPEATEESWWPWLVLAALVLLVPALWRGVRRWRRGTEPQAQWAEILDTARDLGIAVPESATVAEVVAIMIVNGAPESEVRELAAAVDQARYGGGAGQATMVRPTTIRRHLVSAAPFHKRFLALVLPRSLRRRRRVTR